MRKQSLEINKIASILTDFDTKFGIPRQSGIVKELCGKIVFERKYRSADALRGIEGFSHLWLIWGFSENSYEKFMPTVRPPKLGGNKKMGVFATRSPFRPNGLGLSLVKIKGVYNDTELGTVIEVSGVDMVNGTPIYDIKPYLPYADVAENARAGFTDDIDEFVLDVVFDEKTINILPIEKRQALIKILAQDPRPSYIEDAERIYGFGYAGYEIKFKVEGKKLILINIEE
ncbi:MAG: tRNA (N6-threonylcarbamoyladenosine(37)-N6)-methyltransferase TrmO [Clostridia bacterium]|nr:tRNA (N6-threonylcarbamoyladenosine(37)-N6)-methyltransferase TrmO [Clostridia bacterium]